MKRLMVTLMVLLALFSFIRAYTGDRSPHAGDSASGAEAPYAAARLQ